MESGSKPTADPQRRERRARVLGVAAALVFMTAAALAIRWPAPGVAAVLGFAVYLVARGDSR